MVGLIKRKMIFVTTFMLVVAFFFSSCDGSITEETVTGTATITLNNVEVGTKLDVVGIILKDLHFTVNTLPEIGPYIAPYGDEAVKIAVDVLDDESITFQVIWSETSEVRIPFMSVAETPVIDDINLLILLTRYDVTYTSGYDGRIGTMPLVTDSEDIVLKDGDVVEYNLGNFFGKEPALDIYFERIISRP